MTSDVEKITINGITMFAEIHSGHIVLYAPSAHDRRGFISPRFKFKRMASAGWIIQGRPLWEFLNCVSLRERDLGTLDKKLDSLLNSEIYSIFEVE